MMGGKQEAFAAQVDLISFNGPTFKNWDNRVAALRLVQKNLCDAALFDPSGDYFSCSFNSGPDCSASLLAPMYWKDMMLQCRRVLLAWQGGNVKLTRTVCAGELQIPQETLYKKNVLLMRGRFRPFTLLHNDMLQGILQKTVMVPQKTASDLDCILEPTSGMP